jgi:hypothetical protein
MKVEIRHTFESNVNVYAVERLLKEHGYSPLMLPPCPLPLGPIREEVTGCNCIHYRPGYERQAQRVRDILETLIPIDDCKPQQHSSLGLPEPPPGMPNILNLINEEIVIYLNRVG